MNSWPQDSHLASLHSEAGMWECLCPLRCPINGNCLRHFVHGNIVLIPCLRLCIFRLDASAKYLSHVLQWCFVFPTCSALIWLFKDCAPANPLWQMLHMRSSLVTFSRTVVALLNFKTLHASIPCVANKEAWKSWAHWASARYLNISSSSLGFEGSGTSFHSQCNTNPTSKSSSSLYTEGSSSAISYVDDFSRGFTARGRLHDTEVPSLSLPVVCLTERQQKRHKHTHKGY